MKTRLITACILLSVLFCSTNAFARRVYVRLAADAAAWSHITEDNDNKIITLPEGSTDFYLGAYLQLLPNDEVWIAKGVYNNTDKIALFNDDNSGVRFGNITMYGGFAGTESSPSDRAVSDKDGNGLVEAWEFVNETNFKGKGNSVDTPSSFQIIHLGTNSVLDGVTISDNYYTAGRVASGGVVATSSTIRNCIVRDLTTESATGTINGGGLYVTGGHVESCLFETCAAIVGNDESGNSCYGGAIHAYGFIDSTEGVPTGYVKNSVIRNSRAGKGSNQGRGGAIFGKGGLIVENCVIYNNQASHTGGAFYFHNNGDQNKHVNRVIGCTVVNNATTPANGAAASSCFAECDYAEFYNCVFWGNPSTDFPQSAENYVNTVRFRANNASVPAYPFIDGFAFNGTIQNGNANKNASFSPIVLNTPVVGGFDEVAGGDNPKFTNPTEFQGAGLSVADLADIRKANFTLQEGSPLIKAGVNEPTNKIEGYEVGSLAVSFSGKDLMGAERNVGEKFDIGAYEYGAEYPGPNSLPGFIDTNYVVVAQNGMVTINNLNAPAVINIYSVNGSMISTVNTNAAMISVPVEAKGFYVVTISIHNKVYSQKVVL